MAVGWVLLMCCCWLLPPPGPTAAAPTVTTFSRAGQQQQQQQRQQQQQQTSSHNIQFTRKSTTQCYSCMSELARRYWSGLKHIYEPQMSFTDDCGDPRQNAAIGAKPCNSTCMTLQFSMNLLGLPAVPLYIRGCATQITRQGYTNHSVPFVFGLKPSRQRCRLYTMYQLFNGYTTEDRDHDALVRVCPCSGSKCNSGVRPDSDGESTNGAAATFRFRRKWQEPTLLLLLLLAAAAFVCSLTAP